MAVPFLDLKAQHATIAADIGQAIESVIASQGFVLGPRVESFERAMAQYVGVPHAIGVASGTDALLLSLRALELPAGSEVVMPAFTFFATAGAAWNAGLRPVFADVDAATFNVTAETLEAALTPGTRAIVVVHLYGQMTPMREILALAERRGIPVIEDVAQAFGARQQWQGGWAQAGALGAMGDYSFFPTKILGGYGDGGLVTTTDATLADRVRKLRVHGGHAMYHHEVVGTNSRLDALQAAVLEVKLRSVDAWIEGRRRVAAAYDAALRGVDGLVTPTVAAGNEHVFNVYTVRAQRRDELRAALTASGIGSNVYYPLPLHLQPCFAELGGKPGDLPVTERLAGEALSLPMYAELTDAQIAEVVERVREFYGG